ncbi:MAG: tRNA (N6-threonylcarbamoyladenosine(37)-N6)-methyltransferase TrmO [bacterium]|nr:tRNA (N6-threonylcarbamoyladenosine(37)-N6)-methyltransferase TrmO [bacterium]
MDEANFEMSLEAIGVFSCSRTYPYEAPRQGNVAEQDEVGVLRLRPGQNFEQALRDLERFERLWLIYGFHRNAGWKPIVRPPRAGAPKVGVFASRSPYRPNGLGLSCVELVSIAGLELKIRNFDLLDGTPVYDIKPYLPYADSFADAAAGWTTDFDREAHVHEIEFLANAREKIDWLDREAGVDLERFVKIQLREDPDDHTRKRISRPAGEESVERVLAYRTLRVNYSLPDDDAQPIQITDVRSGYSARELDDPNHPDRYGDLGWHRRFRERFGEK